MIGARCSARSTLRHSRSALRAAQCESVPDLSEQPIDRRAARKHPRIRNTIEGDPQGRKRISGRSKHVFQVELSRQSMVGGKVKAPRPQRFEIRKAGTTFAALTSCDILGKDPSQPQRIIPKMCSKEKFATIRVSTEMDQEIREVFEGCVVVPRNPVRPLRKAKFEQEGSQIVAEPAAIDPDTKKRMANGHIEKQRR